MRKPDAQKADNPNTQKQFVPFFNDQELFAAYARTESEPAFAVTGLLFDGGEHFVTVAVK